MALSIQSKTALGAGVLFALLVSVCAVSLIFINQLSQRTEHLLSANYQSVRYCDEMSHAIDRLPGDATALADLQKNLASEEHNITEAGERQLVQQLRGKCNELLAGNNTPALRDTINNLLYHISTLNHQALGQKNSDALATATQAKTWLAVLSTLVLIFGLTLTINFPGYIAQPIRTLTEAIRDVADKKYGQRIHIPSQDEYGEVAAAFNSMTERLAQYEQTNVAELLFEKQRLDTIINGMDAVVIGTDEQGRFIFLNDAATAILSQPAKLLIGKNAAKAAAQNEMLHALLQGRKGRQVTVSRDGHELHYDTDYRVISSGGKAIGEVFILRNITPFKELDSNKTAFLATVSHELKTPISSIKMSAQLLSDARIGSLNAEQTGLVTQVAEDAERLLRLTGELLLRTQAETGKIALQLQYASPHDILQKALPAVASAAAQKHIHLAIDVPEELSQIAGDADKTAWVLTNLLTNAIRHSTAGSDIHISASQAQHNIRFSVQDAGSGIDPKYLPRLFERYFRVPGDASASGTGLGLAISREFIEAQGGSISVESTPGKGSTFTFFLPAANR